MERTTPRGRPRRGPDPERYKQVLDAAADLFLEQGYDATSMQDIADRVDLLKGSLYYYVRSKEDLLFGIVEPAYAEALELLRPATEARVSATEKVRMLVAAHVHYAISNMRAFRIRQREFRQLTGERREWVHDAGLRYVGALRDIIAAGQAAGEFAADLDLRVTTQAMIAQLNSVTEWFHAEGPLTEAEVASQLELLIIRSVAATSAPG